MKYNAFRPHGIISPGMFQGRIDEIVALERCLFQTVHGNPAHFLIQGERGIGKSSLFFLLEHIAGGTIKATDNQSFHFIVVNIDLGDVTSQLDIVRSIGRGLRKAIEEKRLIETKARAVYDWLTNWEILGVRYHKDAHSFDPQEAVETLVSKMANLCADVSNLVDGIVILIDEADRPGEAAGLGAICKILTERLERSNCNNVVLGVAGLPTILSQLKASHESSARIFTTMKLDPLTDDEVKGVIEKGLRESNKRNEKDTTIRKNAMQLLVSLSEGYPHFIQQFAYSAFETDVDYDITQKDVLAGAFAENGALWQLGDKYFDEMYNSKIASDDYRTVLDTMANHGDSWVARKQIIEESKVAPTTVTNALKALKDREIILSDETRKGRGFYRLPTRSFAAWINALKEVEAKSGKQMLFNL